MGAVVDNKTNGAIYTDDETAALRTVLEASEAIRWNASSK